MSVVCVADSTSACTPIMLLAERDENTKDGKSCKPWKLVKRGYGNQDGQEVCNHWEVDNHKDN